MANFKKKKKFIDQPSYPGGIRALGKFIREHVIYPESALAENVKGVVVLKISINNKGKVATTKIVRQLQADCNAEAIRVAKLLTFDVPQNKGMKVKFFKTLNIRFDRWTKRPVEESPNTVIETPFEVSYTIKKKTPPAGADGVYKYDIEW